MKCLTDPSFSSPVFPSCNAGKHTPRQARKMIRSILTSLIITSAPGARTEFRLARVQHESAACGRDGGCCVGAVKGL